jgi:hypothetical protein
MAKPIRIWNGTEWVDVAVSVPDSSIYATIDSLSNHESETLDVHGILDTSQLATKSYADSAASSAVAALVNSAPETLDTLGELAAALGNDENFATTVTNSIAEKAPLASPTLTGTVVLPSTTSIGDVSSTEIGYLDGVTSGIQTQIDLKLNKTVDINQQNGTSYTLVLADAGKLVELSNAASIALTIPTNASVAFPVGTKVDLLQTGAGQVTVGGAGVTINSTPGLKLSAQWAAASLVKRATDTWVLIGNLSA